MTEFRRRTKPCSVRAHPMARFVHHMALEKQIPVRTLAAEAGVCEQTIRNAFAGRRDISVANLEALMNTVGYTIGAVAL